MRSDELAATYVDAMTQGDVARVLTLFASDGDVHSPLYGTLPAADFYPALFKDTAAAKLNLRASMSGSRDGHEVVALWLDWVWTLASGESTRAMAVDIAELDESGSISHFYIVWDSAPIREAFNRQHG